MSLTATPYGLRPNGSISGVYNGKLRQIKMTNSYAASLFYGDPCVLVASGTVERVAATNAGPMVGVFLGCTYTDPGSSQKTFKTWWPASTVATDNYAYVCDDPFVLYAIQANGIIAQADVGQNATFSAVSSGSTVNGMSNVALDAAAKNTTSTFPLKIVGFINGPFSAPGDAKTDVLVIINTHQYHSLGIVGV